MTGEGTEDLIIEEISKEEPIIPDKFKGKSMEEIIASYNNLEKELGRKGQELGELRQLADSFLKRELDKPAIKVEDDEEVDFIEDPKKAVRKILAEELKPLTKRLEDADKVSTLERLNSKYPEWKSTIADKDFQEWIAKSRIRTKLYAEADTYNYDSADELLGTWKELQEVKANQEKVDEIKKDTSKKLKEASVETKSGSGTTSKKVYRRVELMRLRNEDPEKYLAMWPEIQAAYADKRVK